MSVDLSLDHTLASFVYAGTNELSWLKALLLPGAQAVANIQILEKQREKYQNISQDQRQIIDYSLSTYLTRLEQLLPEFGDAYPDVPQAAEYVPVDPCAEQDAQIECNLGSTAQAHAWASAVSRLHAQSDLTRMVVLDPRWYVNIELHSLTVGELLRGEYFVGDLVEVTTDTAEASLATGRVGGSHRMGRRNIAVGRLRRQAAGRDELRRTAGLMERVSPVSRQASASEMMQTPQQRVALALTQAQLIQNSLQNIFNQMAEKPPYKLAHLNLRLEAAINRLQVDASKASLVNTFVPNYAAILQPAINALSNPVDSSMTMPATNQSTYNAPSVGGNYQALNNANPFTGYQNDVGGGKKASDRPIF